jgi:hypothetical protein
MLQYIHYFKICPEEKIMYTRNSSIIINIYILQRTWRQFKRNSVIKDICFLEGEVNVAVIFAPLLSLARALSPGYY